MKRRARCITAVASLLLAMVLAPPAPALDEADRLWLVGERASADGLPALARRTLERFVERHPQDRRVSDALLLLGHARLTTGDAEAALEAFRRAQTFQPPPGRPLEPKFWEAEALFRLRRFAEASTAYDTVVRTDAASPLAPDALYGYAWTELELRRSEVAAKAFRDFLQTWPDHALAPSASLQLGRALTDLKRFKEAVPLLESFRAKYSTHKLAPDAQYLLGWARIQSGDPRGGLIDLRAFVEANPAHDQAPAARRLITETLARHGDRNEQQEIYKELMAQSPATPEGLYDAATIGGRLGRSRDQEAAWRKLRTEFPDHALGRRAALDLATAAFKRKEWKEAAAHAQAASKSDEETVRAEAWLLAGEAELKLKRFQAAEKAFQAAAAVKNTEAAVRFRALAGLGLAHEEQQEWKAALAAYEAVAGKSPDPTLRDWARERANAVKGRISNTPAEKKPKSGS
jgi:TolA-binding protein